MLNGLTFYHGTLRSTIVAFGRLFSDIKIARQDGDGNVAQTIAVPLAYAPKEKWIVRLDSDPGLTNHTYTTLPRLSFEITGYNYDSSRKTNKMNKLICNDNPTASNANRQSVFSPSPYNVDINLYVLTKTQEDAMQIIEQILPTFNPEYTLQVIALKSMNVMQNVPVVLNSIAVEDQYDGAFDQRRFVTHTLSFTLKTNIYGPITDQGVILSTTANVSQPGRKYTASAVDKTHPPTENWEDTL
jgi:hypothetical protein